jgi:hypothetical protein
MMEFFTSIPEFASLFRVVKLAQCYLVIRLGLFFFKSGIFYRVNILFVYGVIIIFIIIIFFDILIVLISIGGGTPMWFAFFYCLI